MFCVCVCENLFIEGERQEKYVSSSSSSLCLKTREKFWFFINCMEELWFYPSDFEIDIALGSVGFHSYDSY